MTEPNEDHVLTRVVWLDGDERRYQFYDTLTGGWRLRAGHLEEKGIAHKVTHFTNEELDKVEESFKTKGSLSEKALETIRSAQPVYLHFPAPPHWPNFQPFVLPREEQQETDVHQIDPERHM